MSEDLNKFLEAAIEAAKKAGELISQAFHQEKEVTFKDATDLVTETDRNCEKLIIETLTSQFPEHKFLGEESVSQGFMDNHLGDDYTWIIDPIDGTTNFVSKFPFVSVSIALAYKKQVVVGVVFNPILNELFSATRGGGAFLNGKAIHVKNNDSLKNSLVATGFPYERSEETIARVLRNIKSVLQNCRAIRRAGSAALDMCYVAKGVFDIYYEETVNAWDIAAGVLIVTEAGGCVVHMHHESFTLTGGHVVCGNEELVKNFKTNVILHE